MTITVTFEIQQDQFPRMLMQGNMKAAGFQYREIQEAGKYQGAIDFATEEAAQHFREVVLPIVITSQQ
jgi:hypothetical protein